MIEQRMRNLYEKNRATTRCKMYKRNVNRTYISYSIFYCIPCSIYWLVYFLFRRLILLNCLFNPIFHLLVGLFSIPSPNTAKLSVQSHLPSTSCFIPSHLIQYRTRICFVWFLSSHFSRSAFYSIHPHAILFYFIFQ